MESSEVSLGGLYPTMIPGPTSTGPNAGVSVEGRVSNTGLRVCGCPLG